ncbi:MAG: 3-octaprenyl-4-hydroxybenzoate carboxy-lyase [Denitrovibrio sp.]|nr:MAG: 3-octaprenyl-4-hydroxybenzoate carboxy-lyase [Denitrovibrio sp.]
MKRIFLGITGASGALYGKKLIEELANVCELHLCITPDGLTNINLEMNSNFSNPSDFVESLSKQVLIYDYKNFAAPVSSGSFMVDSYIIAPASMGFVGRAAGGISSNLIERCADVAMKERRKLLILFREMPLSLIHLENLTKLTQAGAVCMPASPGFYHNPESIDDLISFVVGKIFDIIDVEHSLYKRWEG